MVGDCGQTRRLDNVQSLARGQSSAWMDITSMLVMDWTFWEAVHTGLQRQGEATSQEGSGCKSASDSVRDKDIRTSEEFAREDSGEKGDEPRITNQTVVPSIFSVFSDGWSFTAR